MFDLETEDIQFEINFYEKVTKKSPNFVEALSALAEAYTKAGEYEKGLELDKRLSVICPDDPLIFYNLACSYALTGRKEEAFEALGASARYGYDASEHMRRDPDLISLRDDDRFEKLMLRVSSNSVK